MINANVTTQTRKRQQTLESTILLLCLLGFNYLFSFAWQAYLTRVLGADVYGHVFFFDKLLLCFAYVFDLGYFIVGANAWQTGGRTRNLTFNAIIKLKLLTASVSLLVLVYIEKCYLRPVSPLYSRLVYAFFVALVLEKLVPDFAYRADNRVLYLLICNLCSRVSLFGLLIIFVKMDKDYALIPCIYAIAACLLLGLLFYDLLKRRKLSYAPTKWVQLGQVFQASFSLAGAKLANCCFNCLTVLALQHMAAKSKALSYFILLDLLFVTGRKVLNLLGDSFYLHLHKTADYKWYYKVAAVFATLMLFCLAIFYWQAKLCLSILFGAEFAEAYTYLRIFLIAALPACLSALLAYPLLAARGQLKWTNYAFFLGTAFYALKICQLILTAKLNMSSLLLVYTLSVYVELGVNCLALLAYNRQNKKVG